MKKPLFNKSFSKGVIMKKLLFIACIVFIQTQASAQSVFVLQRASDTLKVKGSSVGITSFTSTHDSTTFVDTCRFQIKQWKGSAALTYTSGYIVDTNQNVGGSFFALTAARYNGGGGYITAIEMGSDTANTTGATFDILIFKDTTSFGASLPANNTQYTTIFDMGKFYVGHEYVTLAGYGTTGGARGYTTTLIPFKCLATSKNLYYLIIANGAYKPGYNAIYRLRAYYERN